MPGLLGLRPSRRFKIFRDDEYPAIFRFNGSLFMEKVDDAGKSRFEEVTEEEAMPWLRAGPPS